MKAMVVKPPVNELNEFNRTARELVIRYRNGCKDSGNELSRMMLPTMQRKARAAARSAELNGTYVPEETVLDCMLTAFTKAIKYNFDYERWDFLYYFKMMMDYAICTARDSSDCNYYKHCIFSSVRKNVYGESVEYLDFRSDLDDLDNVEQRPRAINGLVYNSTVEQEVIECIMPEARQDLIGYLYDESDEDTRNILEVLVDSVNMTRRSAKKGDRIGCHLSVNYSEVARKTGLSRYQVVKKLRDLAEKFDTSRFDELRDFIPSYTCTYTV